MGIRQRAQELRAHAEEVRGNRVYGAQNVAVRAAARYCTRKNVDWQVGYGGRCELGKRALKQWGYELFAAPLVKVWNTRTGRVLMTVVPLTALVWAAAMAGALGTVIGVALGWLLVGLGATYAMGVKAAKNVTKVASLGGYLREQAADRAGTSKTLYVTGATLGLPIVLLAYGLFRLFHRYGRAIGRVVLTLIVLSFVALFVVAIIDDIRVLAMLGVIVVVVCTLAGTGVALKAVKRSVHRRLLAYKRSDAYARRHSAKSAHAYARLEPALKRAYEMSLTDEHRALVTFDDWATALYEHLSCYRAGFTWATLLEPKLDVEDYLHDCAVIHAYVEPKGTGQTICLFGERPGQYYDNRDALAEAIEAMKSPKAAKVAADRRQRRQRRAEVLATLVDLRQSAKTRVCPTVDLPPLDEVLDADKKASR